MSLFLLLSACTVVVLQGNGDGARKARDVGAFDSVATLGSIDVDITLGAAPILDDEGLYAGDGPADEVVVYCDSNLIDDVITEVKGGELRIRTPNGVSFNAKTDCYVHVTADSLLAVTSSGSADMDVSGAGPLARIVSSGSGDIVAKGLDTPGLSVTNSGSGDLRLTGDATDLDLTNSGSGDVRGRDLTCRAADLRNSGSGDIELTVTKTVDVTNSGSGDITIWGNPAVGRRANSGSGDLRIK